MSSQRGRDLLLKIGDGEDPEVFSTVGAARTVSMIINNQSVDSTSMDSEGFQKLQVNAGVQTLEITLEGLFKDSAAEEKLRLSAFDRTENNYQFFFPNADMLSGAFIIRDYHRGGIFDDLETFAVTLVRTGSSNFILGE